MSRRIAELAAVLLVIAGLSTSSAGAQAIVAPSAADADTAAEASGGDKAAATTNQTTAGPSKAGAEAAQAFKKGVEALNRRDFKGSIEAFDAAIASHPKFAAAFAERGAAQIGAGANAAAVDDLSQALMLSGPDVAASERARLFGNRGLAYLNQSKHAQAVADFDKAIELLPTMAFAYANRGMSKLQQKKLDAALADVSKAIELRPGYEYAMLARGFIETDKKQFAEAAADFRKVLQSSPDHRGAILGLRQALMAGKEEAAAKIKLVRLADAACEPSCPEWIAIEGKIEVGAADAFKSLLKDIGNRKLPVFVDSGGGSVPDAMDMGRMIRAHGLDVVVTRTEFVSCKGDDAACRKRTVNDRVLGVPRTAGSVCASSCGFLIASGVHRNVGISTLVGVHQITSFQITQKIYRQYEVQRAYRNGRIVEIDRRVVSEKRGEKQTVPTATKDETYVKIAKYFAEMGVDKSVMPLLTGAPAKTMHWLSRSELATTSMMTDPVAGEAIIADLSHK